MEKLTAYNLYARNERGSNVPMPPDGEARDVYLAIEVEELQRQLAMALDAAAKGDKARSEAAWMQERIEELEKALREIQECPLCCDSITTGCHGRRVHEIASRVLMGS